MGVNRGRAVRARAAILLSLDKLINGTGAEALLHTAPSKSLGSDLDLGQATSLLIVSADPCGGSGQLGVSSEFRIVAKLRNDLQLLGAAKRCQPD
ncbi:MULTISPECIES: hypothetical protein [unclassified Bradyrhizobium]|uniref:hypothetical protein n=1 Tax=unclassified Bradyrhizobium TaxID=2631580 RepID=UPI002915E006|nr:MULTISPECIES: hypothetical protein [unclassified Bradyrhizobium]